MRRPVLYLMMLAVIAMAIAGLPAVVSAQQSVEVRVVDQFGVEIPGSEVLLAGETARTPTGGTIDVSIGVHSFAVYPGIVGKTSATQHRLSRTELITVDPVTDEVVFEWITSEVKFEMQDQFGVEIPGSFLNLIWGGWAYSDTGDTVTLPITDETVYPTMAGAATDGYRITWYVGIQGKAHSWGGLSRGEVQEVGVQPDAAIPIEATYEWITSEVTFELQDQYGVDIPGSYLELIWGGWAYGDTGDTVTLPITDPAVYPTMGGSQRDGYHFTWVVGIVGKTHRWSGLSRTETQPVGVQPDAAIPIEATYEWITSEVTFELKDQYGVDIPGSFLELIWHGWAKLDTGDTVTLPITDPAVYPTMGGSQRDGYHFTWYVGIVGKSHLWSGLRRTEIQPVGVQPDAAIPIEATYEWITSEVTFELKDQYGVDIPGSYFNLIWNGWARVATGDTVTLPITDEAVYPTMEGGQKVGYHFTWYVGIQGNSMNRLGRPEVQEVYAETDTVQDEWWVRSCELQLVDSEGSPVSGSALTIHPFGPWTPGSEYYFPANATADDATLVGRYADGYEFVVSPEYPGDEAPVEVSFRIDGTIEPDPIVIDEVEYRLSCNLPPEVDAGGPYLVDEGASITVTASGIDPEAKPLTYRWDLDDDGVFETVGQSVLFSASLLDGPSNVSISVSASDGVLEAVDSTTVQIFNVEPSIVSIDVPNVPQSISDPIAASAVFSDPAGGLDGPFTCAVSFGDDSGQFIGTIVGNTCEAPAHTYDLPGVYTIEFTVTDKDGGPSAVGASPFVVVFDPTGGHVTGGGMIASPAGAYVPDPSVIGKATFGFVAKYHKGSSVPDGNTQFVFHAGDLRFHSGDYDWLVVAGSKAKFKGIGSVSGESGYGFMLSAIDADNNSSDAFDVDRFRIKIWDLATETVMYDNNLGGDDSADPATEITSGQIRIQK